MPRTHGKCQQLALWSCGNAQRCTGTSCRSHSHIPGCFRHIIKSGSAHVTESGSDRVVERRGSMSRTSISRVKSKPRYQLTMSRHDAILSNGKRSTRRSRSGEKHCESYKSAPTIIESVCSSLGEGFSSRCFTTPSASARCAVPTQHNCLVGRSCARASAMALNVSRAGRLRSQGA